MMYLFYPSDHTDVLFTRDILLALIDFNGVKKSLFFYLVNVLYIMSKCKSRNMYYNSAWSSLYFELVHSQDSVFGKNKKK